MGMPVLDIIPEDNFNDYKVANHHIGGFDWSLTFNWMALIQERNRSYHLPDPYVTPALSGGIFGLWREWWEKSGTYDTNMTEWGGEHIEGSLRSGALLSHRPRLPGAESIRRPSLAGGQESE